MIGFGFFGKLHCEAYASLEGVELCAVAELREEACREAQASFAVRTFRDYRDMLSEVDVVSICTPDNYHCEPFLDVCRAGKPVLVEKPLAMTVEECKAMLEAQKESGVLAMVGHILRFDPRYFEARKRIVGGEIGEPIHLTVRRNNPISSARRLGKISTPLFFLGIHDIDFVLWSLEDRVERVYGEVAPGRESEDYDTLLGVMRFRNGVIAGIEVSWALPQNFPSTLDARFFCVGTKGAVAIDVFAQGTKLYSSAGVEYPHTVYRAETVGGVVGALRDEIAHFVDCVRAEKQPAVSVEDGLRAVEVACALQRSAKETIVVCL